MCWFFVVVVIFSSLWNNIKKRDQLANLRKGVYKYKLCIRYPSIDLRYLIRELDKGWKRVFYFKRKISFAFLKSSYRQSSTSTYSMTWFNRSRLQCGYVRLGWNEGTEFIKEKKVSHLLNVFSSIIICTFSRVYIYKSRTNNNNTFYIAIYLSVGT